MGFIQGRASPCCFWHPVWKIRVVVHGDDLTALGTPSMLDLYEAALQKSFEVKIRGRLGEHESDMKEIRVLNRILRITEGGLTARLTRVTSSSFPDLWGYKRQG